MIRSFRVLLSAAVSLAVAVATPAPAMADDFIQHKARHVHAEQQEIVILTDSLACIADAIDEAALKGCLVRKEQQLAAARSQYKTGTP